MVISRDRRSLSTSITVGKRLPTNTVSQPTLIRSMRQKNQDAVKALYYEFHFGISTFTHDSSGVLYTEIPRPLNTPLVDPTSQKLERCSFEFLIALPYDSLEGSVDSHITLLQDFANEALPVSFSNVHSALGSRDWNIDSITFQITRVNNSGNATAVTCNISLVEHTARSERFVELPKFTYEIPKGVSLGDNSGTGGPTGNEGATGIIHKMQGFGNFVVQVTTTVPHNLKSGSKVKISLSPGLSSFVRNLAAPGEVYEIRVSESTPLLFSYTKTGAGVVGLTTLGPSEGIYIVTSAVAKQDLYVGTTNATSYMDSTYKPPSTKGETNIKTTLAATPINTSGDGVLISVEAMAGIKNYLYQLRFSEAELYKREIGSTNTAAYQKAVSYLVKIVKNGGDPKKVTLFEISQNIG